MNNPHRRSLFPPAAHLSRRRFLATLGASAGGLALTSCTVPALTRTTGDLRFWNLFGGGDGVRLVEMLDQYEADHPDIDLLATTLAWGAPYYTKLAMAAVGGRPPDVAISHLSRLPAYAPADLLEPFDLELLAEYEIGPDKFLPNIWESTQFDGEVYAIPLDTHPFVMYYNTEVCEQAGLLQSDGSLTPLNGADQVLDAFQRAQEVTGETGLAYASQDVATPFRLFWSLYSQLGGEMLAEQGQEIVMDRDLALQSLEFMANLTMPGGVSASGIDYGAAVAIFANGRAGFHWNGEWEVSTFLNQDMPFSMTTFPAIFGNPRVFGDSHTFVLPKRESRTEEERRIAYEFIRSMLNYSLIWARGGHIPAYVPIATSQEYQSLEPQSNYASAAEYVNYYPRAWYSGSGSQLEGEAGAAFQAVHSGELTPEGGLSQFRSALVEFTEIPPPV